MTYPERSTQNSDVYALSAQSSVGLSTHESPSACGSVDVHRYQTLMAAVPTQAHSAPSVNTNLLALFTSSSATNDDLVSSNISTDSPLLPPLEAYTDTYTDFFDGSYISFLDQLDSSEDVGNLFDMDRDGSLRRGSEVTDNDVGAKSGNSTCTGTLVCQPDKDSSMPAVNSPTESVGNSDMPFARIRRRRKREMKKCEAKCRDCSKTIAQLLLHGTKDQLAEPFVVDVQCTTCREELAGGPSEEHGDPASSSKSRKRKRDGPVDPRDALLSCELCKGVIGSGGVRLGSNTIRKDTELSRSRWISPSFLTEVQCVQCNSMYALCSDCGGGGKFRTGKYRPIQMFENGRATCNLTHLRMAKADFQDGVWRIPIAGGNNADIASSFLQAIPEDMIQLTISSLNEGMLGWCASPKFMTNCPDMHTWDQIQNRLKYMNEELARVLRGHPSSKRRLRLSNKRYVAVRWTTIHRKNTPTHLAVAFEISDWDIVSGDLYTLAGLSPEIRKQTSDMPILTVNHAIQKEYTHLVSTDPTIARPRYIWSIVHKLPRVIRLHNDYEKEFRAFGWKPLSEAPQMVQEAFNPEFLSPELRDPEKFEVWVGIFEECLR